MIINPIDKNKSIALEASAGTGKTFQLSMRVVAMLINGVNPKDILCLTFTNKATDEMLDRILETLNKCVENSLKESEKEILKKAIFMADKEKSFDDNLIEMAKIARNNLLKDFSSLKVNTLNSFSNLILKNFPFEAGIKPDYEISSSDIENNEHIETAFYLTFSKLIDDKSWKSILTKLNEALNLAPIQLIDRLQNFAKFVASNNISLQHSLSKEVISKYELEKLIDEMISINNKSINLNKEFVSLFDISQLNKNQIKVYNKMNSVSYINDIIEIALFQKELNEHSWFSNFNFTQRMYDIHSELVENIKIFLEIKGKVIKNISLIIGKSLYDNLKNIKQKSNKYTFNDIDELVYNMLVSGNGLIDKDYLYFRLDGRINHILIDEFQDTSEIQWLILKPLAEESMAGLGQKDKIGSFFYVGDPKQNLYRFRGGSSSLFNYLIDKYNNKLIKDTLLINYRSQKNIIEFVNLVCSSAYQKFKTENLKIFDINQKPQDETSTGYVEVSFIETIKGKTKYGDFTISKINEIIKNDWNYKDIAILVPSNSNGENLKNELTNNNIPVKLETSIKLSNSNAFKIIMALAEFLKTNSNMALTTYLFSKINSIDGSKYADSEEFSKIKNYLLNLDKDDTKTIFESITYVIQNTDLQNRFKDDPDFHLTLDVISKTAPNEKNIEIFLEEVNKVASNYNSITAENANAVTIMTIHKSKGLQFPVVILPKLDINLKISQQNSNYLILKNNNFDNASIEYVYKTSETIFLSEEEKNILEEENKLCLQDALNRLYVAMTRAEKALIIGIKEIKDTKDTKKNKENTLNTIEELLHNMINEPYSVGSLKNNYKKELTSNNDIKTFSYTPQTESKIPLREKEELLNFNATAFGSFLHKAAFYLENDVEDAINKAMVSNGAFISNNDINEIKIYLEALLSNSHWKSMFNGHIFRERKIGIEHTDNYSIIDFYSVFDDRVELIDYKTGEITTEQEEDYKKQIRSYANLLKKIYQLPVNKSLYKFHNKKLQVILVN